MADVYPGYMTSPLVFLHMDTRLAETARHIFLVVAFWKYNICPFKITCLKACMHDSLIEKGNLPRNLDYGR